jgi:hypothetical protein
LLASAPEPESPSRAGSLLGAALGAPFSRRSALWLCLLSIPYLVGHGSRPAIDFGYHWGLMPIMLAEAWFALFGATPQANEAVMVVCALLIALGVARMAAALRMGTLGIVFLIIALPFAFPTFTVTYALEAAVLSNALAEQAADSVRPRSRSPRRRAS